MGDKRVDLLKRANKLFRQGKTESAVKEYKKILAIKPDDLEVRRIVGDLQLRQNNSSEAIEQFEWIADHYLKEGFFAKAIAMYKRITRVEPNYEQALYKLADLYTKQGLVIEAKQIYLDIAEECKRQKNHKKALGMYKKILEFDRHNIKMRTLLADNYLKEDMIKEATEEYIIAADILIHKKEFQKAEQLLLKIVEQVKDNRIIHKLLQSYTAQNDNNKAIQLLNSLGDAVFRDVNLLKVLGELYLKMEQMGEAEKVFLKIAELAPEETEVVVRLGKVYLQREETDRAFQLFQPVVDKNIQLQKYEEAASLLRLIIASVTSYIPALTKLAQVYKASGKTNNLIALYESLIPVYERKGMRKELQQVLEELVKLSDSPFTYQEQLDKLSGQVMQEQEESEAEERESEFVSYNLRQVDEALRESDFPRGIEILMRAKSNFPQNLELREKLVDVYLVADQVNAAVEEGKELLDFYKNQQLRDKYTELHDRLSQLKPEDDKLVEISHEERTSIEIDFPQEELNHEIEGMGDTSPPGEPELLEDGASDDLLDLSAYQDADAKSQQAASDARSLSHHLSELDFYISERYFGEADKLMGDLKTQFPGNQEIITRMQRLEKAKAVPDDMSGSMESAEEEHTKVDFEPAPVQEEEVHGHTEQLTNQTDTGFVIETAGGQEIEVDERGDSHYRIDLGESDLGKSEPMLLGEEPEAPPMDLGEPEPFGVGPEPDAFEIEPGIVPPSPPEEYKSDINLGEPEPILLEPGSTGPDIEVGDTDGGLDLGFSDGELEPPMELLPEEPPPELGAEKPPMDLLPEEPALELGDDESLFEIESSIADETSSVQELSESKMGWDVGEMPAPEPEQEPIKVSKEQTDGAMDLEIEFEGSEEIEELPAQDIDQEMLIQSPSVSEDLKEEADTGGAAFSGLDELDLDSVMEDSVPSAPAPTAEESPFKDITGQDLGFDAEEELLEGEPLFLEDLYLEPEKNVKGELEANIFWLKEVEKQRTSTIEKNMMEIFDEFKRGVDEKIGQEDYDTRYNLGIAYKEMGLLEEAIHEFLISSKHSLKYFDSAGLLGMCFREKGMFSEAIAWFEKAVNTPNRKKEEYLAIKFELVLTFKMQEDYHSAVRFAEEIMRVDPAYRNVSELFKEIKKQITA